ncbi:hypothetical protein CGLO_00200 [Colletotrichum gloeosporioides Cg-14]|uniref:Uncharacterized protein n=1 Tax=Colletotrichum gloeosporioides (strain Cg-14) TaxID=1237896 RepID=T0KV29_COLGC|nr:hypothetical protein CGLO_00200 [Colletotrichum gloeosporioides Cg-14]
MLGGKGLGNFSIKDSFLRSDNDDIEVGQDSFVVAWQKDMIHLSACQTTRILGTQSPAAFYVSDGDGTAVRNQRHR